MFNTLRPRQDGRNFQDDIFKGIFLNENVWIPLKFSLKFVPKGPINNIPVLVQIMVWRRPGDKPLSGPMIVSLLTHICVTRPQWGNQWMLCAWIFVQWADWYRTLFFNIWTCHCCRWCNAPWLRHNMKTRSALLALSNSNYFISFVGGGVHLLPADFP